MLKFPHNNYLMNFTSVGEVKIPTLGLGTYGMGGGMQKDTSHDQTTIDAIKYAIELGLTHIDTAEIYAQGHAEELVAKAVMGMPRTDLFITTKVHPSHLAYENVILACRQSLDRLRTHYVDLYLIHWPNPDIPLSETIPALDYLLEEGLTRYIGVSNFSVDQVKEAQSLTKNKLITNQVEYSIFHKDPEKSGLLQYTQQSALFLTAYSPLGQGKIKSGTAQLESISRKYNKTPVQVALNYLISQPNVIAIPKSANRDHLKEIAGSVGWHLTQDDWQALKDID